MNYGLSTETLSALKKKGIESLFPIQKHVFDPAMNGKDLIGRAKTGSGKTLAFAIPIIENLLKEKKEMQIKNGRTPRAIIITPTRELANQVAREFQSITPTLKVHSFYGGVPVNGNKRALLNGIDVAVGTPGRLIDLIEQNALKLNKVRIIINIKSSSVLFYFDADKICYIG